jgi:hypothetical protein
MARAERRLSWAGWTTRQLPGGLCRPKGQVRCDPVMGLQTDPEATQRPLRDSAWGGTEGNGPLGPCEGKPSRTVLRGGGSGDDAPSPATRTRSSWSRPRHASNVSCADAVTSTG